MLSHFRRFYLYIEPTTCESITPILSPTHIYPYLQGNEHVLFRSLEYCFNFCSLKYLPLRRVRMGYSKVGMMLCLILSLYQIKARIWGKRMIHVNDDSFSSPASFLLDLPSGTYVVPTNLPLDVSSMRTGIKQPLSGKQKTSPTFSWQ